MDHVTPVFPPVAVTSELACKSLLKYLLLATINNQPPGKHISGSRLLHLLSEGGMRLRRVGH